MVHIPFMYLLSMSSSCYRQYAQGVTECDLDKPKREDGEAAWFDGEAARMLWLCRSASLALPHSPANRVDTRDYRIYDRILLKLDLRSRCCPRQDPTRIYQKSQLFADCRENCVFANPSGFLEALCYKGFVEIDF